MKTVSAVLFASVVAAKYTVYPGHDRHPVVVTKEFQPVPTYVDGEWSTYEAISTVFTDAYHHKFTVTNTDQVITMFHISTTIIHQKTIAPTAYDAPTTTTWSELYEEIHEAPYRTIGPHAINGYTGNPKYTGNPQKQYAVIKEYRDGKSYTYTTHVRYKSPPALIYTMTYDDPGTYTEPSATITVRSDTRIAAGTTISVKAKRSIKYGSLSIKITAPTTVTATYAKVSYSRQREVTSKMVIATTTLTYSSAGEYTYVEPTTTSFSSDTVMAVSTIDTFTASIFRRGGSEGPFGVDVEVFTMTTSASPTEAEFAATKPASPITPSVPDPSSDVETPVENFGRAVAGYVKRGGVLRRHKSDPNVEVTHEIFKRIIQV